MELILMNFRLEGVHEKNSRIFILVIKLFLNRIQKVISETIERILVIPQKSLQHVRCSMRKQKVRRRNVKVLFLSLNF